MMKDLGAGALGLILIAFLAVFGTALALGIRYFAAPASVAIDNRVFHESQQYNDGMSRDLDDLRQSWMAAATPEQKDVVRATIMHRFGNYDAARLPADQRAFLASVRGY